jgi:hypothetical protein
VRLAESDRSLRARDQRVAFTLLSVLLASVALLLVVKSPGTPTAGSSPAPRGSRTPSRAPARGIDLKQATAVARHFLRAYLSVVYGHGPARVVPNAAPDIAASIAERRRVPPALHRLHPQVLSVTSAPAGEAEGAEIAARISDDEVLTYSIRLLVTRSRGGQLVVAKVGEG